MPDQAGPRSWLTISTSAPSTAAFVDGSACRTRADLFAEWARVLRFPAYFGHNWDAFADSIQDAMASGACTVAVTGAVQLLADDPPTQFAILLDILDQAASSRQRAPGAQTGLRVILLGEPAEEAELRRRTDEAIRQP